MKSLIIKSLFILLPLLSFYSCRKNTNGPIVNQSNSLYSSWDLIEVRNGWSPTLLYAPGDIQWRFLNDNSLSVSLASGVAVNTTLPYGPAGTYSYVLDSTNHKMEMNGMVYTYEMTGDSLLLDDNIAADGQFLLFVLSN